MLIIETEKLNRLKQLATKQEIKTNTLIKILSNEILDMQETYTLKEILMLISFEFGIEIKYSNFQRILHRIQKAPSIETKKPMHDVSNDESPKTLSIDIDNIDVDEYI